MNLEHELQQALKRKSPPRGFEDRVLRRIASGETIQSPEADIPWTRRLLPLAASLAIAFGGSYYLWQQERQQQMQTERAASEVVLALQIASEKVSAVQVKVQEITYHESAQ
jgi:hypothetical protein